VPDKTIAWAKGTVRKAYSDGKTFDVQLDSDSGEVSSDGTGASAKGTVTVNITQPEYIAIGCEGLPLQNKVCVLLTHLYTYFQLPEIVPNCSCYTDIW
jgi:hypothetical protein